VSIAKAHADGVYDEPLVSVIIPSKNSERTIAECLGSVAAQSYKRTQVIVVDRFSTDSTREIAQAMGALVVSLDGERSEAKNLGAKWAGGRYLYFVDSDHRLDHDAIADCVESIREVDGVVVRDLDIAKGSRLSRLVASRRRVLSYDSLNVAVRFVRKDAFDRLGGFNRDLYLGEDLDFQRRFVLHGFKMAYSRAKEWHLGSPIDLRGLLNRSSYYSSNYPRYFSENSMIPLKRLSPTGMIRSWKMGEDRGPDLLQVVFLGFLADLFLMLSLLLNLTLGQNSLKRAE